jgi:hypothetical protein
MRIPRLLQTRWLALLVSLVGGIYSASAATPLKSHQRSPTPIDACTFLQTGALKKSLGQRVLPGTRTDDGFTVEGAYSSTCYWQIDHSTHSPARSRLSPASKLVLLNVMHWPTAAATTHFLQSFRDASADHTIDHQIVPINGLGDEALWWGDGVAMRIGQLSFGVSTLHVARSEAERRRVAESLARLIAAQIASSAPSPH